MGITGKEFRRIQAARAPPTSICWWASSSSLIAHIVFWTLNALRRPQTLSIELLCPFLSFGRFEFPLALRIDASELCVEVGGSPGLQAFLKECS